MHLAPAAIFLLCAMVLSVMITTVCFYQTLLSHNSNLRKLCLLNFEIQKERDKLFCYYSKNLPTLQLKPIKVEMLNVDPDLYLLHDVITDKETQNLKKLAKPQVS